MIHKRLDAFAEWTLEPDVVDIVPIIDLTVKVCEDEVSISFDRSQAIELRDALTRLIQAMPGGRAKA